MTKHDQNEMTVPMLEGGHVAILGATGGGKSYTARGMVEQLIRDGRRVCILDPVGVWWGIKANFAGDGPGLPVAVIGGEHGDHPLTEAMGEPLGALIATNNLPMVVDTSEMGVAERNRFLRALLAELYRLNKAALWLVLEEADEVAPQVPRSDGSPQLLDAVDRIARRGRSRGFRLLVVSQRPQVIHKNVLTQVRTMIAHRLGAPLDIKAVQDWMAAHGDKATVAEVAASLPGLGTGEAWIWNPEAGLLERRVMPVIATFDSSRTPAADEAPIHPVGLAQADLSAIQAALATPSAERKARGRSAEAAPAQPDTAALDAAREAGRAEGHQLGYTAGLADGAAAERRAMVLWLEDRSGHQPSPHLAGAHTAPQPSVRRAASTPAHGNLSPSAAKLLAAVAEARVPIHYKTAAKRAGLSVRSSALPGFRKALIDGGLITESSGLMAATAAGVAVAGPAPRGLDEWFGRLTPGQASMLRALQHAGEAISLDEIASRAGVSRTSSALGSGLKELVELGLAERPSAGLYRIARDMIGGSSG